MSSQHRNRKGDVLGRYCALVVVALAVTMALHTRALRALEPPGVCESGPRSQAPAVEIAPSVDDEHCLNVVTQTSPRWVSRTP